jgi:hypothetical protein
MPDEWVATLNDLLSTRGFTVYVYGSYDHVVQF